GGRGGGGGPGGGAGGRGGGPRGQRGGAHRGGRGARAATSSSPPPARSARPPPRRSHWSCWRRSVTSPRPPASVAGSSWPAASAPPRRPSATWSWSRRWRASRGWPRGCSGSARPACSTTCSCRAARNAPAATPAPTTSPWTDDMSWEYAPAPEARETARLRESYRMFIGGEFTDGSGESMKTVNPANEEVLAEVAVATPTDVDAAVAAARTAYEQVWRPMPGAERAKYLFRISRLIQERARELAVLESLDNGKPIKESRDVDVPLAAAHFFYYAGWADKLGYAGFGPDPRPLGVAGQIIPWNFPLLMAAWKLAPALAAGNTCVLKPAETTPLTALVLAEI